MLNKSTAIAAVALVAGSLAISSAEAQTRHRVSPAAAAARAQVPPRATTEGAPQSPAVYEWGKYQGQDPDANVRLMLRKDVHN